MAGSPTEKGDAENSYDYDEEEEESGAAGEGRFVAFRFFNLDFYELFSKSGS